MPQKSLSEERIAFIRESVDKGISYMEIARRLGCSECAVRKAYIRHVGPLPVRKPGNRNRTPHNKGARQIKNRCLCCGKPLQISARKFCSESCAREYRHREIVNRWLRGEYERPHNCRVPVSIKEYIWKSQKHRCHKCRKKSSSADDLIIYFRNGDIYSMERDNMELLCPECYSTMIFADPMSLRKLRAHAHAPDKGSPRGSDQE